MRQCNDCERDLPQGAFYKLLRTTCKECQKAKMKEHYQTPGYKVKQAEYQRERLGNKENLDRHKVRQAVRRALKAGEITKAGNCVLCHADTGIEAHHANYDEPLEVTWLCRNCHASYHTTEAAKQAEVKARHMSISSKIKHINHIIQYAILTK